MEPGALKSPGVQPVFRCGRERSADPRSPTLHGIPTVSGDTMSLTRRDFAARSAVTGAGVALAGTVGALATAPNALASTDVEDAEGVSANGHGHGGGHGGVGYGALIADPKGLLALPAGFKYRVITYSGQTTLES